MTWNPDVPTLEQAIIRHCSPTLAALKPASLFTFPGAFVASANTSADEIEERRASLLAAIGCCAHQLAETGLRVRVLAWRSCGALIYVYRPQQLLDYLTDERAAVPLEREGYRVDDLGQCLDLLAERIVLAGGGTKAVKAGSATAAGETRACPCDDRRCRETFPHEMGYFLGYPYADVEGFIVHRGQNFIAQGLWKVYENRDAALATFARYRRCTRAMTTAYQRRGRLAGLAVRA